VDRTDIVTPSPAQLAWHDMELGMFFHFDIPVYKQGWDWRSWTDFPAPDLYRPARLDTDQWMEAARAMGARYAVFVAKHCSGFLQWQSDLYPYGVKQSSWRNGKGDVVADFVESCGKYGIKPGLYASVSANGFLGVDNPGLVNHGQGGDDAKQREYVRICEQMAVELWSRYGELCEVWFDGGAIPADQGGPDLIPILEKHQPDAIVFQGPPGTPNMIRWVGNERGVAPYPCWSTTHHGTGEAGTVEGSFAGDPDGRRWIPGECDVPIRNHEWFWQPGDERKIYPLDELMEKYCCSVGRNCNLLLNANPGPDGLVPEADLKRYEEFGREIHRRFATAVASTSGSGTLIDLDLEGSRAVNHVVLMEDISRGERILEYVVEYLAGGETWRTLCAGESIGHKRIQQFDTVLTSRIRLRATKTKAAPHLRRLAAHFAA
jgi:alpha-L-fucosidase